MNFNQIPSDEWNFEGYVSHHGLSEGKLSRVEQLLEAFEEKYDSLGHVVEAWNYEAEVDAWKSKAARIAASDFGEVYDHVGKTTDSEESIANRETSYQQQEIRQSDHGDRIDWSKMQESLEVRHLKLRLLRREMRNLLHTLAKDMAMQRSTIQGLQAQLAQLSEQRRNELRRQILLEKEMEFMKGLEKVGKKM